MGVNISAFITTKRWVPGGNRKSVILRQTNGFFHDQVLGKECQCQKVMSPILWTSNLKTFRDQRELRNGWAYVHCQYLQQIDTAIPAHECCLDCSGISMRPDSFSLYSSISKILEHFISWNIDNRTITKSYFWQDKKRWVVFYSLSLVVKNWTDRSKRKEPLKKYVYLVLQE